LTRGLPSASSRFRAIALAMPWDVSRVGARKSQTESRCAFHASLSSTTRSGSLRRWGWQPSLRDAAPGWTTAMGRLLWNACATRWRSCGTPLHTIGVSSRM